MRRALAIIHTATTLSTSTSLDSSAPPTNRSSYRVADQLSVLWFSLRSSDMATTEAAPADGVYLEPVVPEGTKTLSTQSVISDGEEFLLDGKLADIKLTFGWGAPGFDVDASLAMFDAQHKCVDVIWWDKKKSHFCSVMHLNDDMTGAQEGDNETIAVNIEEMPLSVHYMIPVITVYSKGKTIKDVKNISLKIVDIVHEDGKTRDVDITTYTPALKDVPSDAAAVVMGIFSRKGAWWEFSALGKPGRGRTIKEIVATTPLDTIVKPSSSSALPKRVLMWAVQANNVAAGDAPMFGPKTSDCFAEIVCKGYRTLSDVVEKTLNPKWNMKKVFLGETTESDFASVEINVWDHDTHTEDDFLGSVYIILGGLVQKGVGVHEITLPLGSSRHSLHKPPAGVEIQGEIVLKCEVVDPNEA